MQRWVDAACSVPPWAGLIAVVVMFNVAVSQPLLDVVGRNPEFLVAHDASPSDVVVFAAVLTIVVPLVVGVAVAAILAANRVVGVVAQLVIVGALAVLLWIQLLDRVLPDLAMAAAVALLGVATAVGLTFSTSLRRFFVIGLVVPLASLGLFLFTSEASALVRPAGDGDTDGLRLDAETLPPIVFLVFDGLPMASLLDANGDLDAETFPSFGRLAQDATLYRNTTTVHPNTEKAVPALLTGRVPRGDALPIVRDHPQNLFALLDDAYAVTAAEPVTRLCPASCSAPGGSDNAAASRMADDLRVIALHVLLPDSATSRLPVIDEGWRDFAQQDSPVRVIDRFRAGWRDHRGEDFLAPFSKLDRTQDEPTLHFSHALLPHTPWEFLPSGQRYPSPPAFDGLTQDKAWVDDPWLVTRGHQRHLLQTGYVDMLLGRVLDRLEAAELYDDALIVVAADHGISFVPGMPHRRFTPETAGETVWVPFFMKAPQQTSGGVDDRPVMTIDVVPSILDHLGVDTDALDVDGVSVLGDIPIDRDRAVARTRQLALDPRELAAAARRRHDAFQPLEDRHLAFSLVPRREHRDLLGQPPPADAIGEPAGVTHLDDPWAYSDLDVTAPILPVEVRGRLDLPTPLSQPTPVAVAVNGRIEAVTLATPGDDGSAGFAALVPPAALVDGRNTITPHLLVGEELIPVPVADVATFGVRESDGQLVLEDSDGTEMPVTWEQYGAVEEIRQDDSHLMVTGWAGDPVEGTRAEAVVLIADERVVAVTVPQESRRYVRNRFNAPELQTSGFSLSVPLSEIPADAELAVVGVGADRARHVPPAAAVDTATYTWWTPSQ